MRSQVEEVEEKLGGSIKALQIQIVRQFVEHEVSERDEVGNDQTVIRRAVEGKRITFEGD